jgi:hypothetical protein
MTTPTDPTTPEAPENGQNGAQGGPNRRSGQREAPEGENGREAGAQGFTLREEIVAAMLHVLAPDRILIPPEQYRIIGELADAVLAEIKPLLAPHYQHAVDAAVTAEQRAEQAEKRLHLAHQARRGKEHQLDDIRRALCDIGFMQDDDPYSHADLADVIRQNGQASHDTDAATEATEPATITDPEWLRQQYADAVQPLLMAHLPTAIAYANARDIADVILNVRDRHLCQLRQRLRLADNFSATTILARYRAWLAAEYEKARAIDDAASAPPDLLISPASGIKSGLYSALLGLDRLLEAHGHGPSTADAAEADRNWDVQKAGE